MAFTSVMGSFELKRHPLSIYCAIIVGLVSNTSIGLALLFSLMTSLVGVGEVSTAVRKSSSVGSGSPLGKWVFAYSLYEVVLHFSVIYLVMIDDKHTVSSFPDVTFGTEDVER